MNVKLLMMDILTFVCIPIYADDNRGDDLENLTIKTGAISTSIFNFQEEFWSHSYVMKTLFGYTESKGFSASYKFAQWLSADAIVMPIKDDEMINYRFGITFKPIEGLNLRFYGGINDCNDSYKSTTINMAAFLGYKCDKFTLGVELSHILNSSYIYGRDYFGYSAFASVKMIEFADLYVRFDEIHSKNNWNIFRDEMSAVLGMQFQLNERIKIAPNFKMIIPKLDGVGRSYFAYVNFSIEM
jgi:hypothetical protein